MKLMSTGLAAVFLLGAASAHAEEIALNPGEWAFTQEGALSSAGNTMPIPSETSLECVTEEDAAFDISDFGAEDCTLTPVSESSTHAEYAMTCSAPEMTMTGSLELELGAGGDSVSVMSRMTGDNPAIGEMTIVVTVEGERKGECS